MVLISPGRSTPAGMVYARAWFQAVAAFGGIEPVAPMRTPLQKVSSASSIPATRKTAGALSHASGVSTAVWYHAKPSRVWNGPPSDSHAPGAAVGVQPSASCARAAGATNASHAEAATSHARRKVLIRAR